MRNKTTQERIKLWCNFMINEFIPDCNRKKKENPNFFVEDVPKSEILWSFIFSKWGKKFLKTYEKN